MFYQKIMELGFSQEDLAPSVVKELPIPNFDDVILFFRSLLEFDNKVCIHWDGDPDGIIGGYMTFKVLSRLMDRSKIMNYTNKTKVHGITQSFIKELLSTKIKYLIIVDSSSNDVEELKILLNAGVKILILDHHPISKDLEHNNLVIVNCYNYIYGNNCSGAYVAHEVVCRMHKALTGNAVNEFMELAALTIITDVCDRDVYNRSILKKYIFGSYPQTPLLDCFRDRFSSTSISFFSTVSSRLNLFLRLLGANYIMDLLVNENFTMLRSLLENWKAFSEISKNIINELIKKSSVIQTDSYDLVFSAESIDTSASGNIPINIRNFLGAIAGKMSKQTDKLTLVLGSNKINYERIKHGSLFCFSARDPKGRDILSIAKSVGIEADGHEPAFGGVLYDDFSVLMKRFNEQIISKYGKHHKQRVLSFPVVDIDDFLASDVNLLHLGIWNTIRNPEDRIKIEFTLTGGTATKVRESFKQIQYGKHIFKSYNTSISVLDRVYLVPDYNGACELFLEKI